MTIGNSLGPNGIHLREARLEGHRVIDQERADRDEHDADQVLRLVDGLARPSLLLRLFGGGHSSPSSVRVVETRLSWSFRNCSNCAPVTNASVQPFFTSASFHCLRAVHLLEHLHHRLLGIVGNARRRKDSAPVGECQVDSRLFQRRGVDALDPLVAGHREHPQLTGLDLVDELAGTRRADGDLLAEQRGQQITATVIGDEVDRLRVDADRFGQFHREQVVGPAGRRTAADRHLATDRPSTPSTKSSTVLNGESAGTKMAPGSSISFAMRRRVGRLDLGPVGVGGADDAEPHRHHQVVVALFVHQAGHRDGAARADDVEDLDAAGDVVVFHDLDRGAGREVVAAARAVGHHHAQPVEALCLLARGDAAAADQQRRDHGDDQDRRFVELLNTSSPITSVVMLSNTGPDSDPRH